VTVLGLWTTWLEDGGDGSIATSRPGMRPKPRLPVMITDFIPGQEIGNVSWVVKNGTGLYEHEIEGIAAVVGELLRPGNPSLEMMSERAKAMARPNASEEIVAAALELIG
jgi:UDP-N-acetylglucosamine:LPS N-acetylglucosamine transferase